MILDSNLIIYAAKPEYPGLRRLIAARSPVISVVSKVEVLGYHRLGEDDRRQFEMRHICWWNICLSLFVFYPNGVVPLAQG